MRWQPTLGLNKNYYPFRCASSCHSALSLSGMTTANGTSPLTRHDLTGTGTGTGKLGSAMQCFRNDTQQRYLNQLENVRC